MVLDSPSEVPGVSVVEMGESDLLDQSGNSESKSGAMLTTITNNRKVTKIRPFHLAWNNLRYSVTLSSGMMCSKKKETKVILDDINGGVKSGEMIAVMGTSGAGKTTFMNILAGRTSSGKIEGNITLNGAKRGKLFKRQSCYVEQDDVFLANLTVTETFVFNALMRLPKRLSRKEKVDRAKEVITQLGLSSCAHTRIGSVFERGVSGGERKRCAIGIELITNPKILFLDEPTSGLDAFTSFHVMQAVQNLAHEGGRAVVLTIHQPRSNIFDLFDKLLLLSKGKTVFYGPASEASDFFISCGYSIDYSPADFFLDITTVDTRTPELAESTTQRNESLIASFEKSKFGTLAIEDSTCDDSLRDSDENYKEQKEERLNYFFELSLLYQRAFKNVIREKRATVAAYMQSIIMALLTGIVFYGLGYDQNGVQNRLGVLFFVTLMQSFGPIIGKVILFHLEKALFIRERTAGVYRVSTYYLAKSSAEFPVTVWSAVIYACIAYWMVGLNDTASAFFFFLLVLVAQFFTAESLGLVISAIAPNIEVGNALAPIVIIVFMLFGGFYINSESIPVWLSWIRYISFIAYTYAALVLNEFEGATFTCDEDLSRCQSSGDVIISNLGLFLNNKWANLACLFGLGVFFRLLGYVALLLINKPKSKLA